MLASLAHLTRAAQDAGRKGWRILATLEFGGACTAAMRYRQPTPSSIAAAEARIEEGERVKRATAALAQAREADRSGDNGTCERAAC